MPSADYGRAVAEATAHHALHKTYSGKFLRPHKPVLTEIIDRLGVKSALDYGCGKGAQYTWVDPLDGKTLEQAWGFPVTKYDPAWPPFAADPVGTFDLVICTHVLGSIPIKDLDWAFSRMYGLSNKAVYLAEKIGPIGKTALTVGGRPVNWSPKQWLRAAAKIEFGGELHFTFRLREDAGVFVDHYVKAPGNDWVMTSNRPA